MNHDAEIIRTYIFETLGAQYDQTFAKEGLEHLIAVGQIAAFLALKQNLNPALAMIAGYLHDIAFYTSHYHPGHAKKSAQAAQEILPKITSLNAADIVQITTAIAKHSDKEVTDDHFSEILKDADVISHAVADGIKALKPVEKERLQKYI